MDIREYLKIKKLLSSVPKGPWHYRVGDENDHWELWSSDEKTGCVIVSDDSGVEPDEGFLIYLTKSREIIDRLMEEVEKDLLKKGGYG